MTNEITNKEAKEILYEMIGTYNPIINKAIKKAITALEVTEEIDEKLIEIQRILRGDEDDE